MHGNSRYGHYKNSVLPSKSRSVNNWSKCSDLDHLGPDCEWIGPNIEICQLTPPASKINFAGPKTWDVKTDAAIYIYIHIHIHVCFQIRYVLVYTVEHAFQYGKTVVVCLWCPRQQHITLSLIWRRGWQRAILV